MKMVLTVKKNTLYIKTPCTDWINIANFSHRSFGWRPVFWVGDVNGRKFLDNNVLANVSFYPQHDALLGKRPPFLNKSKFRAIDSKLLNEFAFHQPIIHELNIFDIYNIDLVICPTIPHRIFDYIIYVIAKYKNIPFLMIESTAAIKNYGGTLEPICFPIDSIENRTKNIFEEYKKVKKSIILSDANSDYIQRIQSTYDRAMPNYLRVNIHKSNATLLEQGLSGKLPLKFKVWSKAILRFFLLGNQGKTSKIDFKNYFQQNSDLVEYADKLAVDIYYIEVQKRIKSGLSFYKNFAQDLSTKRPYFLFTAHKQPERTTCPDAGYFYSHIDILKVLDQVLPKEFLIFYKEHPSNFRKPFSLDSQRSKEFFETLININPKRIKLLKTSTNQFDAIDGSTAVVSATGTSCWEGLIRGKPALIFGSSWYENCHGVFRFENVEKLEKDIEKIIKKFEININEVATFLEYLYQIDEDISWRREINLGAISNSLHNKDYKRRVEKIAKAYKNGLQRFEASEKLKIKQVNK